MPANCQEDSLARGIPRASARRDRGVQRGTDQLGLSAFRPPDEDQVARAALDDLVFDRAHAGSAEIRLDVALLALAMEQNAPVARLVTARFPRDEAPAEFGDQPVVREALPADIRFTVVVVAPGATFAGWNNY